MTYNVYWIHLPEHTDLLIEGYIGVSQQPKTRFRQHKNQKKNPHLQNAFQKYGDQIQQTIVLQGPKDYCYTIEKILRPSENIGWNIIKGGDQPKPYLKKGSDHHFFGKHHTEESKKKIGENNWQKGKNHPMWRKKHTETSKQKMITSHIGKCIGEKNPFYGKHHTEETKQKMKNYWEQRRNAKKVAA